MSKLKSGLIQMSLKGSTEDTPEKIRDAMLEAHLLPKETQRGERKHG